MNNLKTSAARMAPEIVGARARRVRRQRLPLRLAVRGGTPPARRARRGADDQQRPRPRGQRRDAARCTRKIDVSSTESAAGVAAARVPRRAPPARPADRDRRARRLRPQRRVRRHARARRPPRSTPSAIDGPRRGDALPSDSEPRRTSSAAATSSRFRTSPARFTASPAPSGRTASCSQRGRAGRRLERGVSRRAGGADARRLLSGVSDARGHAAGRRTAGRRHVVLLPPRAVGRRRAGCRCSGCTSTCGLAEPETVVAWREMWLGRVESVDRRARPRRARASVASDPFFGRGGNAARRQPARSAPQARDRRADRQRRAPDRDHLAQLPPGPLRRSCSASRPPTARSRTPPASGSASSASRWRCTAGTASTVRSGRHRCARRWTCDASALAARSRHVRASSASSATTAPGPSRTATSISGSSCCTRAGSSRWRRCRSRSPWTSKATSGRSSSFRSPTSTRSTASRCSS